MPPTTTDGKSFQYRRPVAFNHRSGDRKPASISGCDHLRGPALHELFHTIERAAEVVSGRGEAQAEVRGHVETVSGREQDSALGGGLAEGTSVRSAHEPREGRHSALRADPAKNVAMSGHEAIQSLQIPAGGFLGF